MPNRQPLLAVLAVLVRTGRQCGPYVLLEILLPGGTLMALLLYAHHRLRMARGLGPARRAPRIPAVATTLLRRSSPVARATDWLAGAQPRLTPCRDGACR